MEDSELEDLLLDLESDRVERKQSMSDSERIAQAICAFANDLPGHRQPGVVFVGATGEGKCAGLPITEDLLLRLADLRSNGNIAPFPFMTVQKHTLGGGELAVVVVHPADAPPVRFKGQTWIRVGPRRAIASAQEEIRLSEKRRSRDLPFDLHPIRAAAVSDLDLEFFRGIYLPSAVASEVIERNERTVEEQLASLRFLSTGVPANPTVLGMLVTGRDPLGFVPGAYIQFLRIDGDDLLDPIKDATELSGRLAEVIRLADERLFSHNAMELDMSGSVDRKRPEYPIVALQQLVRNAVMHRSYEGTHAPVRVSWFSDRIEISSPGGPFGNANATNFGKPGIADYRNPHLADAMKTLGFVQRFGMGIPLARSELRKNGNPELEFQVTDTHVLAIVRRRT